MDARSIDRLPEQLVWNQKLHRSKKAKSTRSIAPRAARRMGKSRRNSPDRMAVISPPRPALNYSQFEKVISKGLNSAIQSQHVWVRRFDHVIFVRGMSAAA